MELEVRRLDNGEVALCDERGVVLPGQCGLRIEQDVDADTRVVVTFLAIDHPQGVRIALPAGVRFPSVDRLGREWRERMAREKALEVELTFEAGRAERAKEADEAEAKPHAEGGDIAALVRKAFKEHLESGAADRILCARYGLAPATPR